MEKPPGPVFTKHPNTKSFSKLAKLGETSKKGGMAVLTTGLIFGDSAAADNVCQCFGCLKAYFDGVHVSKLNNKCKQNV